MNSERLEIRKKLTVTKLAMDIFRTLAISFFIWFIIKGAYPENGVGESSRQFILLLSVFFLIGSVIICDKVSYYEEQLEELKNG